MTDKPDSILFLEAYRAAMGDLAAEHTHAILARREAAKLEHNVYRAADLAAKSACGAFDGAVVEELAGGLYQPTGARGPTVEIAVDGTALVKAEGGGLRMFRHWRVVRNAAGGA